MNIGFVKQNVVEAVEGQEIPCVTVDHVGGALVILGTLMIERAFDFDMRPDVWKENLPYAVEVIAGVLFQLEQNKPLTN